MKNGILFPNEGAEMEQNTNQAFGSSARISLDLQSPYDQMKERLDI